MTLSGRPLLPTRTDARLFVGRSDEVRDIDSALRRDLNVVVSGAPGLGKTSLLHALTFSHATDGWTYIRAAGISDGAELLATIAAGLGAPAHGSADSSPIVALQSLHALAGADGPRVVLVDDVGALAGHAVFGRLRDELWSLGWQWVVATRADERAGLLLPPADAFFEYRLELEPLSIAAATTLLARRQPDWDDVTIKTLVTAVGGNPRALLDAARAVAEEPHRAAELAESLSAREAAIARAGRPEAMLAAELSVLGAASASDEALLDRLGWTRSRAVQVLGRLEELGLVTGEDVRTGRGRPRRVFRVVSPAEFEMSVARGIITA